MKKLYIISLGILAGMNLNAMLPIESEKKEIYSHETAEANSQTTFNDLSPDIATHIGHFIKQDDIRNLRLVNRLCSTVKTPQLCTECYLIKKTIKKIVNMIDPAQFPMILTMLRADPTITPKVVVKSCTHHCNATVKKFCSLLHARNLSRFEKNIMNHMLCSGIDILNAGTRSPWAEIYSPAYMALKYHKTEILKLLNALKKYHGFNVEGRDLIEWIIRKTHKLPETNVFWKWINWVELLPWTIFGSRCQQENTRFDQLPPAIIVHIADLMQQHDVKNLRLTNKLCAFSIPACCAQGQCDCIICYLGLEQELNNA